MSKVHNIPVAATAEYDATDRTNVAMTVPAGQRYDRHILTIVCTGTPSAGTVTVRRKVFNGTRFIAVTDRYGAAKTISLASEDHMVIHGPLEALELDIAGLATATGWQAHLAAVD